MDSFEVFFDGKKIKSFNTDSPCGEHVYGEVIHKIKFSLLRLRDGVTKEEIAEKLSEKFKGRKLARKSLSFQLDAVTAVEIKAFILAEFFEPLDVEVCFDRSTESR